MSSSAAVAQRSAPASHRLVPSSARGPRDTAALMLVVITLLVGCVRRQGALADVPISRDRSATALFVLRASECDANVAVLQLFDRTAIRRGISLVGVVLSDGDSTAAVVRSQLRAYDVTAPLLRVSPATRDSLAHLVGERGPAIVVRGADGAVTHVLAAPQTSAQYRGLVFTLTTIATHAVANR